MATTKKPAAAKKTTAKTATRRTPVKKTVAKKPTVAKASTTKKAVVKKAPAKKATTRKKQEQFRSFRVSTNQPPFNSFQITRQTVYWVILMSVIIFAQLWILKVQYEVLNLLDAQVIEAML